MRLSYFFCHLDLPVKMNRNMEIVSQTRPFFRKSLWSVYFYHSNRNEINTECMHSCVHTCMHIRNKACIHTHICIHIYSYTCKHITDACMHIYTDTVLTCHVIGFSFNIPHFCIFISPWQNPSCSAIRIKWGFTFSLCTKKENNSS